MLLQSVASSAWNLWRCKLPPLIRKYPWPPQISTRHLVEYIISGDLARGTSETCCRKRRHKYWSPVTLHNLCLSQVACLATRYINHAEELAAELAAKRRESKATKHPIIFVAHLLGGFVMKRALINSSEMSGAKAEHLRWMNKQACPFHWQRRLAKSARETCFVGPFSSTVGMFEVITVSMAIRGTPGWKTNRR